VPRSFVTVVGLTLLFQGIDESRVIARAARYADEKLFRSFLQKFLKGIM
jgi:hypothetical protein